MPGNNWICTRKEPFIKQQYLRAVTKKQTFVTKSNSMKRGCKESPRKKSSGCLKKKRQPLRICDMIKLP